MEAIVFRSPRNPGNSRGVALFYLHTDHLNTPRKISRPVDNVIVWRWDSGPFGSAAANEDPDGDSTLFSYNPRFPGQYFDAETGLNYNYFRDYDPVTGRYVESDPVGLFAGVNTYAYVTANPIAFFDPNGLGKEGGQTSVGGDDPLVPRSINKNTPRAEVMKHVREVEEAIKRDPTMNPKRAAKLRAWIKVARRNFTRSVCPPFLEDLVFAVIREACLMGDLVSCQNYVDMGGEIQMDNGS